MTASVPLCFRAMTWRLGSGLSLEFISFWWASCHQLRLPVSVFLPWSAPFWQSPPAALMWIRAYLIAATIPEYLDCRCWSVSPSPWIALQIHLKEFIWILIGCLKSLADELTLRRVDKRKFNESWWTIADNIRLYNTLRIRLRNFGRGEQEEKLAV